MRLHVAFTIALLCACGTKPAVKPAGPELCDNKKDDNGDGKVDCLDPTCFDDGRCNPFERCGNGVDDNGDGKIDCEEPACSGLSCGPNCICMDGHGSGGGLGGGAGGSGGGSEFGGGVGGGAMGGGVGGGLGGGAIGGGVGGGVTGGGVGGGVSGGGVGGGVTGGGVGGGVSGTELCTDGVDNDGDRAIDCNDTDCSGASCSNLSDGKPCRFSSQCAGSYCLTELGNGSPNGYCSNLSNCNPSTQTGCNGGVCIAGATTNDCYQRCTGLGLSGPGACRVGYVCVDPDENAATNNSYCRSLCTSDSECAGSGSGYGCNPWSKRCETKDRGRGRYGAACSFNSQCETGICLTNGYPGGYCTGICRGDLSNCAQGGYCTFNPNVPGDNFGVCAAQCTSSSMCRQSDRYNCWAVTSMVSTCQCLTTGSVCLTNNECCTGACNNGQCQCKNPGSLCGSGPECCSGSCTPTLTGIFTCD